MHDCCVCRMEQVVRVHSGHWLMVEQPDLVNTEMETWLRETLPTIQDVSGVQAFDLVYGTLGRRLGGETPPMRAAL